WKSGPVEIRWAEDWPWGECELENELGGRETLFYALLTPSGHPYTRVPSQWAAGQGIQSESHFANEIKADAASRGENAEQSAGAVTYQFRLLSESGGELSPAQRQALR